MRTLVIASIVMVAALAIIGLTVKGRGTPTPTPTNPAAQAKVAQINGKTIELELESKELDCEYPLIGKTSPADARAFCHNLRRDDWEEWALQFPELAKAREAVAR
jgi:hypothetical protein